MPTLIKMALSRQMLGAAIVAGLGCCACGGGDSHPSEEQQPPPPVSGDIVTWAGTGMQGNNGDGLAPADTWLDQPMEVQFAADGRAFIADWNSHMIRVVRTDDTVKTLIGQEIAGDWPCQVPTDPTQCQVPLDQTIAADQLSLNHPMDVAIADDGTWYFAAWHNHKIEHYDGSTKTVAIVSGQQKPGFSADGIAAKDALLNFPDSLVIEEDGAIIFSDERNNRIRRIEPEPVRTITTVVGVADMKQAPQFVGEGTAAADARLALSPYNETGGSDNPPPGGGLALDKDGNLYIADTFNHCVRRVSAGTDGYLGVGDATEEVITTVAGVCGDANGGYSGDGGAAIEAHLQDPHDVEIGPDGNLYIADTGNNVVRRVNLADGTIKTIAGTGDTGFSGDNGPATKAKLRNPYGIAFDGDGNLYIVDTMNNRIRKVVK